MRRWPAAPWRDLAAAAGFALTGMVLALIPVSGPARTATLLPLVLFVPGYALAAALFLPGEIGRDVRVVLSVAFSVGVTALGALAVELVVGLDRPVWAGLLASATVAAAAVAMRRRASLAPRAASAGPFLPRVGPIALVAILLAIVIAGWAIASATEEVHRQASRSHFTSLWLLPRESEAEPAAAVGVENHQGRTVTYWLTVRRGARTVGRWRLRLAAGQEWQGQFSASAISGAGPLVGRLDRGGLPFHRVAVRIGGSR
jgi:uncharacterized membrane protein